MTQAHKTVGALVEVYNDLKEGGCMHGWYAWLNWEHRIFEVLKEEPRGHLHVRDIVTGEVFPGFHDDNFQTLGKKRAKEIRKEMAIRN